jgi:hypothetical protein
VDCSGGGRGGIIAHIPCFVADQENNMTSRASEKWMELFHFHTK